MAKTEHKFSKNHADCKKELEDTMKEFSQRFPKCSLRVTTMYKQMHQEIAEMYPDMPVNNIALYISYFHTFKMWTLSYPGVWLSVEDYAKENVIGKKETILVVLHEGGPQVHVQVHNREKLNSLRRRVHALQPPESEPGVQDIQGTIDIYGPLVDMVDDNFIKILERHWYLFWLLLANAINSLVRATR